ncbi:hypothetical protein DSO57_1021737 [Entomophthora muscae]|uniref:Uncharacterized protein n=1 Tax=Entomophthora muscae TaxID=34485 RepID=A0ACC2RHZ5_9FUNG|nr:hypothetical protein DSO57_1021737 [Entomophthora muscae]
MSSWMLSPRAKHDKMVLTTGAASPSVTPFPRAFSGPSLFVSEVLKQPKVSSHPLEKDITNAPSTPLVLVLSPGPAWAPFQLSLSITSKLVLLLAPCSTLALWQCTLSLFSVPYTLLKTATAPVLTIIMSTVAMSTQNSKSPMVFASCASLILFFKVFRGANLVSQQNCGQLNTI